MGYALQLDDGRLRFEVDSNWQGELREPREKVLDLTTGAKVADGAWHHVAAVVDSARTAAWIQSDGRPQRLIAKDGRGASANGRSALNRQLRPVVTTT